MSPDRIHTAHAAHARCHSSRPHQRGFSLPVAILAIVLLSLLGAAMVSLVSFGHRSVANIVVSTRAFYAAESGGQYALGKLFPLKNGTPPACRSRLTLTFTPPGLTGCRAVVTCAGPTPLNGHNFYTLTSTGQCASGENKAVRQIQIGARS